MEYQLGAEGNWQGLEMHGGSFYVGNLSSVLHRVVHCEESFAEGISTREAGCALTCSGITEQEN